MTVPEHPEGTPADRIFGESALDLDALSRRVTADPEKVERGLVQLVLTLVELLRQLMERQAIRRLDAGALTEEETERVGETLMLLEKRMTELREHFGLEPEDLNIDLGPLGRLL
ncbi:MAG TPA: gas vesicle protein K [Nocardioidaceae bacterium]|nr:gas vesicle protein K [Nocardioidaceae bacterium]